MVRVDTDELVEPAAREVEPDCEIARVRGDVMHGDVQRLIEALE